jgi:calcium-dependent protein kinase
MGICQSTTDNKKGHNDDNSMNNAEVADVTKHDKHSKASTKVHNVSKYLKSSRITKEKDIAVDVNKLVQLSTGTPLDNYILEKQLGEGSYGTVMRVKHKDIGVHRAMKKIFNSNNKLEPEKEKEILNEIEMLKSLDHPNIVKVFEFYNTKEGYYIITEYCKGGELFEKILANAPFEESAAAYIMYQILSAVFYCHNMSIIHRDLKPENILIENEEKDTGYLNIKIIDFGTAKIFNKNKTEKKVIGSAYYIAPEVLQSKYSEKCDIWSCGVIMYIMLCGKPPFSGDDDEILDKIKKGKYDLKTDPWNKISAEAKDLIKHMLDMNQLTRISAQKTLQHKWFKKFKMKERFTNVGMDKLKQSIENIKNCKTENKLQEAALAFLVHNSLHLPEVKEIVKVFKNIDLDGDGRITKKEMNTALGKIYGVPDTENDVEEIFNNIDNDNNGYIEYEEYIRASINKETLLNDNILRYTFKFFDKDSSGEITADEICQVLFSSADQGDMEKLSIDLMAQIDVDKNASIDFKEFKIMMTKLIKR